MENLKLISLRIDPNTLKKVDQYVRRYGSYTRNGAINLWLTRLMECAGHEVLWDMLTTNHPYEKGHTITFDVSKEELLKRSFETTKHEDYD